MLVVYVSDIIFTGGNLNKWRAPLVLHEYLKTKFEMDFGSVKYFLGIEEQEQHWDYIISTKVYFRVVDWDNMCKSTNTLIAINRKLGEY